MDSGKTAAYHTQLRQLLARNATLKEAAAELKKSKSTLHRDADKLNLPRRRRDIGPEKERKLARLISRAESERVICRLLHVGKGTVYRRKETRRKRLGLPKSVRPYKCAGPCGKVVCYVPCQICIALRAAIGKSGRRARAS